VFLVLFLVFLVRTLLGYGYAYDPQTGVVGIVEGKYWQNLIDMWYLTVGILVGVVLLLYGILRTIVSKTYIGGIWPAGIGVVIVVLCLLLCAGWNNTCYYPSNEDLQSSLHIMNSCSSEFTLRTMAWVSIFIPFVLAYIAYAWRALDSKKIDRDEMKRSDIY
jgi:cytochrome d ubiquinol oxidase subunit II